MKGIFGCIGGGLLLVGCKLFTPENLPATEIALKDAACVLEHAVLDEPALNAACDLLTPQRQEAARALAKNHRVSLAREMTAQRMAIAHCDAGPEAGK